MQLARVIILPMLPLPRSLRLTAAVFIACSLPLAAHADPPPLRAASSDALKAALTPDTHAETLPGGYVLVLPEAFASPTIAIDPIHQYRCSRVAYVYSPDVAHPGGVIRRVVVHFEPDDQDASIKSARLIARLLRLHRERFGREPVFSRAAPIADVWFTPTIPSDAKEGGETRDANVYVFAASGIRTPLELVRTISHEWGHLTLPAARGYTEPEYDAAGYLGERLYLKWLCEESKETVALPDDGTHQEDLALYYRRQIAPLIQRWQDGGPTSKEMDGDRTTAMDYYIGASLGIDEAFGPAILGKALWETDDDKPRDLLRSMEKVIASVAQKKAIPIKLPAWVPLAAHRRYSLSITNGTGSIALADRPALSVNAKSTTALRVLLTGWKWVRSTAGDVTVLSLKQQPESVATETE